VGEAAERIRDDRFGLVLASIIVAILSSAVVGTNEWGRLVSMALLGGTLLLILRTTEARPRTRLVAAVVVVLALALTAASVALGDAELSRWTVPTVGAFLAVGAPVAIVRRLAQQSVVSFQTVLGALCLYLLAGLFFAYLYGAVDALTDGPFFSGSNEGSSVTFLYFSFVTMATVGYGDLTAASDLGRMLAATEGLIGQLYLVTVVAVLVSNLGRPRRGGRN
jgi:Ion channel